MQAVHMANRPSSKTKPIGVRLANETLTRIERVGLELAKHGAAADRNSIIKVAVEAGLERLEAELREPRKAA
jgi:hypothetical protein